ncbi:MAG: hypothetical protein JXA01_04875 [Dehalococcoidia bacterium]|nr:hypothetical protein [Dehalococcoidia bacterium]
MNNKVFIKVDELGPVKFYLVDGSSSAAEAIYRARFKLYTREGQYIADNGITIHLEKKMEYDVFDPISLQLAAVNEKGEIFCGMRIVPYHKKTGLPMENRYSDKMVYSDPGFYLTHYVDKSGIADENIAEFSRFFRVSDKKEADMKYDPISMLMWKYAAQLTKREIGGMKVINLAFGHAIPSLSRLYSKFGMGMVPAPSGNFGNYKFPVPTKLDTGTGQTETEYLEFVPMALSREKTVARIQKGEWEALDLARPKLDKRLLEYMVPEEFGLGDDDVNKQKKDLLDFYKMLYSGDGQGPVDESIVIWENKP